MAYSEGRGKVYESFRTIRAWSKKWTAVRDLYRYDKRLQINIFKYFCMFEEHLRATICNSCIGAKIDNKEAMEKIFSIIPKFKNIKISKLHENLDRCDFSELIEYYARARAQTIKTINISQNDLMVLKNLRNCICHNRLLYLEAIKDNEGNIVELDQALLIMKNIINTSHQKGFMKGINACKEGLKLTNPKVL